MRCRICLGATTRHGQRDLVRSCLVIRVCVPGVSGMMQVCMKGGAQGHESTVELRGRCAIVLHIMTGHQQGTCRPARHTLPSPSWGMVLYTHAHAHPSCKIYKQTHTHTYIRAQGIVEAHELRVTPALAADIHHCSTALYAGHGVHALLYGIHSVYMPTPASYRGQSGATTTGDYTRRNWANPQNTIQTHTRSA